MKEELQQIIQCPKNIQSTTFQYKNFEIDTMTLQISYQPIIYNNQSHLAASITLIPKERLMNSPLQIELKGFSHLQTFDQQESKSLQVTQQFLGENDDKMQTNDLMGVSNFQNQTNSKNAKTLLQSQLQLNREVQYFLQGCNVLYQLDQQSQERLVFLEKGEQYTYPLAFLLPKNLPASVDQIILNKTHITIKYSLEIKVISIDVDGKKIHRQFHLPFKICQPSKTYPYQLLTCSQKIRCYHQKGKIQDKFLKDRCTSLIRCLCPSMIFDKYLQMKNLFKSKFNNYDLFHLELLVTVSRNNNIFLTVRAYKQPQVEELTINHQSRQHKKLQLKEIHSMGEVPNDISVGSMKETERRLPELCIYKVEVEMIGELVNICSQNLFKKSIYLNQSKYDMLEGEIIVKLDEFLPYTKSCKNELFELNYRFNVKPFFGDSEQNHKKYQFQEFVIEQIKNDLPL